VPVIVVGNITVGGTGKTPMILWLIEHCRAAVCASAWSAVVTAPSRRSCRGGSRPSRAPTGRRRAAVDRAAHRRAADDRPDRSRAVKALLASEPLDLILSDDGMQHYRLARDLELVLIDAARGLGNRRCLPAGPLREPVERLQSVDAVLFNGAAADREGFAFACSRPRWSICSGERRRWIISRQASAACGGRDRQPATFLQYP
jgi:tetraacyldisaccharide 4'-kinase